MYKQSFINTKLKSDTSEAHWEAWTAALMFICSLTMLPVAQTMLCQMINNLESMWK
jgi:hypothetical protein